MTPGSPELLPMHLASLRGSADESQAHVVLCCLLAHTSHITVVCHQAWFVLAHKYPETSQH